jgi:hypothetical protein
MATPKKAKSHGRRSPAPLEAPAHATSAAEVRSEEAVMGPIVRVPAPPDPEVTERAARRRFTATYNLGILRAADACAGAGELGALLRREARPSPPSRRFGNSSPLPPPPSSSSTLTWASAPWTACAT